MTESMRGIRVLEVASWTFVPAAGAIMADWGADVLKIEHPVTGDPQRGLAAMGVMPGAENAGNFMMQVPNRGKRSLGLDIASAEGRAVLAKLVATADVFLTNMLPSVRHKLRIDVDDIRADNPNVIYVRGHGQGANGPEADRAAFDGTAYWARAGLADTLRPVGFDDPLGARPAIGDVMGGLAIAGGIAAALFERERTGVARVVDISLLNTGMWQLQGDIAMTGALGLDDVLRFAGGRGGNPLVGNYPTADGRWVFLNMMQSDRFWPDLCAHLGRPDLVTDPRFADAAARAASSDECVTELSAAFATRTLDEWREALTTLAGAWAPVQRAPELKRDGQVVANGYVQVVTDADGRSYDLVGAPAQFDGQPHELRAAPAHGEHTDEVLLDLGYSWDELIELKLSGAIS